MGLFKKKKMGYDLQDDYSPPPTPLKEKDESKLAILQPTSTNSNSITPTTNKVAGNRPRINIAQQSGTPDTILSPNDNNNNNNIQDDTPIHSNQVALDKDVKKFDENNNNATSKEKLRAVLNAHGQDTLTAQQKTLDEPPVEDTTSKKSKKSKKQKKEKKSKKSKEESTPSSPSKKKSFFKLRASKKDTEHIVISPDGGQATGEIIKEVEDMATINTAENQYNVDVLEETGGKDGYNDTDYRQSELPGYEEEAGLEIKLSPSRGKMAPPPTAASKAALVSALVSPPSKDDSSVGAATNISYVNESAAAPTKEKEESPEEPLRKKNLQSLFNSASEDAEDAEDAGAVAAADVIVKDAEEYGKSGAADADQPLLVRTTSVVSAAWTDASKKMNEAMEQTGVLAAKMKEDTEKNVSEMYDNASVKVNEAVRPVNEYIFPQGAEDQQVAVQAAGGKKERGFISRIRKGAANLLLPEDKNGYSRKKFVSDAAATQQQIVEQQNTAVAEKPPTPAVPDVISGDEEASMPSMLTEPEIKRRRAATPASGASNIYSATHEATSVAGYTTGLTSTGFTSATGYMSSATQAGGIEKIFGIFNCGDNNVLGAAVNNVTKVMQCEPVLCGGGVRKDAIDVELETEEKFTLNFQEDIIKNGVKLIYHKSPTRSAASSDWIQSTVKLFLRPGNCLGATLTLPKISWAVLPAVSRMKAGDIDKESWTSLGLLDVHSLVVDDEALTTGFFSITASNGHVYVFEAPSPDARDYIVKGLYAVISRLTYHMIDGNADVIGELFSEDAGQLTGELPSLVKPWNALSRVTNAFLEQQE